MDLQETLAVILVLAAAGFVVVSFVRGFRGNCGKGCGTCQHEVTVESANRKPLTMA